MSDDSKHPQAVLEYEPPQARELEYERLPEKEPWRPWGLIVWTGTLAVGAILTCAPVPGPFVVFLNVLGPLLCFAGLLGAIAELHRWATLP